MWVFLHSGHNHSESTEATSSALGPELLVLVAVVLLVSSLVGFYVTRRYLSE